jgi:redox-sensitive bicupin YhaK (pirin superfamily)
LLDVSLSAGARAPIELPASYNALAVVAKGRVSAGGFSAVAGELLLFNNDGERLELSAAEDAHVIVLSGEPIAEPIVQYGPFVMNTVAEIQQAMLDVSRGKFGPIPE